MKRAAQADDVGVIVRPYVASAVVDRAGFWDVAIALQRIRAARLSGKELFGDSGASRGPRCP
jgi:hypothetical protein